jgi:hypothetical protein
MDWRCGSSGRVPALQVGNSEFKRQTYKKETGKLNFNNIFYLTNIAKIYQ